MKQVCDEVRCEISKWSNFFSGKNPGDILGLYDDRSILWPTFSDVCRYGRDEIVEYFNKIFLLKNRQVNFDSVEIIDFESTVVSAGTYTFSWEDKATEKVVKARYSFVYHRNESGWKIISHHSSEMPSLIL